MTETDLEKYVNSEGRSDLVRQVREKIDELNIQYIYFQFVSVTGRIVGKGIPADQWEAIAERGFPSSTSHPSAFTVASFKMKDEEGSAGKVKGSKFLPATISILRTFRKSSSTSCTGIFHASGS